MTLQEAIEQAINLGEKDPRAIAATLRKRYDDKWLASELMQIADDVISGEARKILSGERRSSQSLGKIGSLPKRDLMLQAAWLPGLGWIEFGKFTTANFETLALQYRKGAAALSRYAEWCEASAALMREQEVAEFRQVKGQLPALPPPEVVAA